MTSLFGFTTVSALEAAQKERDKWRSDFYENNETIERLQQENNALAAQVQELTRDLNDSKIWVGQLQESNREQADRLGKQVEAISNALDEATQQSLLYNQATVEIAQLKLTINRYRTAINNLNLEVNS